MVKQDFITSNTSLAAYLLACGGFTLRRIQFDGQFGIFVFAPEKDIETFVELFQAGDAEGNINRYQSVRDDLIDRIKRGRKDGSTT